MAVIAGRGPDGQPKVPSVTAAGELAVDIAPTDEGALLLEVRALRREMRALRKMLCDRLGGAFTDDNDFEG